MRNSRWLPNTPDDQVVHKLASKLITKGGGWADCIEKFLIYVYCKYFVFFFYPLIAANLFNAFTHPWNVYDKPSSSECQRATGEIAIINEFLHWSCQQKYQKRIKVLVELHKESLKIRNTAGNSEYIKSIKITTTGEITRRKCRINVWKNVF